MEDDSVSGTPEDIRDRLERFERDTRASISKLEAIQAQINSLTALPEPVAVHAEMAADGTLTVLDIDAQVAGTLDAEALERDLNLAIAQAYQQRPTPEPPSVRTIVEDNGFDLGTFLAGIFADPGTEPAATDDFHDNQPVHVTLHAGAVRSVSCQHQWLRSTPLQVVGSEVRRTVNNAVDAARGRIG